MRRVLAIFAMAATVAHAQPAPGDDPYLWLEDVEGAKALAWVKQQDAVSRRELEAKPEFKPIHERLLAIYNSHERIPGVVKRGKWLYNFWQDDGHPRGIWRRATLAEYRKPAPAWETVIDIDKLSADEHVLWVWKGASCLYPDYRRCLVSLSRGGADAVEVREFDAVSRRWVKHGFFSPESKQDIAWRDANTLYIARDFGPGTMTHAGYPRIVKEWKRGTPLAAAKTVFEGEVSDVGSGVTVVNEPGRRYEMLSRNITFWTHEDYLREDEHWIRLQVPEDARVSVGDGWLFVQLRSDWKPAAVAFKGGSLITARLDAFLSGGRDFAPLFEPSERVALEDYTVTRNAVVLDLLDNVKSRVQEARWHGGHWVASEVAVPPASSIGVGAFDRDTSDDYWMTVTGFLEPTTLYLAQAGKAGARDDEGAPGVLRRQGPRREPVRGHLEGRHEDPVLRRDARGREARWHGVPPSSTATAASRSR